MDFLLTVDDIKDTRAKAVETFAGKVYSFKVSERVPGAIDGHRLRRGVNGKIYAVYPDDWAAAADAKFYPYCRLVKLRSGERAFDLSIDQQNGGSVLIAQ